jgi:MurNAc alpha-1-phosphate uridylyltransferase
VVNGDIFTDYPFSALLARPVRERETLAHLVLIDNPAHHPAGDFGLKDGCVSTDANERYTFSGIGVYDPELFSAVERGTRSQLATVLKPQIALKRVSGERYGGRWVDVGTPERLAALDRFLRENS